MPGGNRTGSLGQGPRTGRGLGYCTGFDTPGYVKGPLAGIGRGFGFGRGMRFGMGMGGGKGFGRVMSAVNAGFIPVYPWMQSMSKEDEINLLKSQADELNRSQKDIEKRLGELEKEKE